MHTVIETPTFLSDYRRAGLSEHARLDIVGAIADDPLAGDVITGTGGARKRRMTCCRGELAAAPEISLARRRARDYRP